MDIKDGSSAMAWLRTWDGKPRSGVLTTAIAGQFAAFKLSLSAGHQQAAEGHRVALAVLKAAAKGRIPILILFAATPNRNTAQGGFMPIIRVSDGKVSGDTFRRGYDAGEALGMARAMAEREAEHWGGDYTAIVAEDAPPQ